MSEIFEIECGNGEGQQFAPKGLYKAKFVGCELLPAKRDSEMDYGEAIRWKFQVVDGEHTGKMTSNIGAKKATPKNVSGRILSGMGIDISAGKAVNIRDKIGQVYTVTVQPNQNRKAVVTGVFPAQ